MPSVSAYAFSAITLYNKILIYATIFRIMQKIPFTPSIFKNFTFSPVLDGETYFCTIEWLSVTQRWWLELKDSSQTIVCYQPLIASSCKDLQLCAALNFNTNFIYRASSKSFEIGGDKRNNCPSWFPPPPSFAIKKIYSDVSLNMGGTITALTLQSLCKKIYSDAALNMSGSITALTLQKLFIPVERYLAGATYPVLVIPSINMSGSITALTRKSILREGYTTITEWDMSGSITVLTMKGIPFKQGYATITEWDMSGSITALTMKGIPFKQGYATITEWNMDGSITALTMKQVERYIQNNNVSLNMSGTILALTRKGI